MALISAILNLIVFDVCFKVVLFLVIYTSLMVMLRRLFNVGLVMGLSLSLVFIVFTCLVACKSKRQPEEVSIISQAEWQSISDTADFWSKVTNYTMENQPGSCTTLYDWGNAFIILHGENATKEHKVLRMQDGDTDTSVFAIENPCTHEKDMIAFLRLVDSVLTVDNLCSSSRDTIKKALYTAYNKGGLFADTKPFSEMCFQVQADNTTMYIKVKCTLGSTRLDRLCEGHVTLQYSHCKATFSTKVHAGNLALIGNMEMYIVSDVIIPKLKNKRIAHQKYKNKNVYFLSHDAKVMSARSVVGKNVKQHKVLVSFL
jgi:hypothetical protein